MANYYSLSRQDKWLPSHPAINTPSHYLNREIDQIRVSGIDKIIRHIF